MINLPAYSSAAILALFLGDLIVVLLFALAAGPVFISARDVFGRPLEPIGNFKRVLLVFATIVFAGYLALQLALAWNFVPYFTDSSTSATETVTARTAYPNADHPVALWITTQNHRFGVTKDIFDNLAVGDVVEFHFRPIDDTLYEIHVVQYGGSSLPSPSPVDTITP